MKITIWSDLHLEFMPPYDIVKTNADVLILSGDICLASCFESSKESPYYDKKIQFLEFFKQCSDNYSNVIYIMGNHEHYNSKFDRTSVILREICSLFKNIHFLDKSYVDIDGIRFFGATLWTDFYKANPVVMETAKHGMNDYQVISDISHGNYHKLNPSRTLKEHKDTINWLEKELSEYSGDSVVVGHHAPSYQCRKGNRNPNSLDHCYYSDLDQFIIDHTNIKLWTFGHTHVSLDIKIGETRIISNAFGYPHEYNKEYDPNLVIEI